MKTGRRTYLIAAIVLVLAAISLFGLLPQLNGFNNSLRVLRTASSGLTGLAAAASLLACVWGAAVYVLLAYRRLPLVDTALVQYAGLFVNRILPAGMGGLSLNFVYLRAHKHSTAQAGTVVALNNLLGFVAHLLLAIVMLLGYVAVTGTRPTLHVSTQQAHWLLLGVAVVVLAAGIGWLAAGNALRRRVLASMALLAQFYVRRPRRLLAALAMAALLTLSNVASFWLSCRAVDVTISLPTAFLVFTFGVALATATPTPGGLGGAEAGLVAGLLTQHVAAAPALAATLLYRLVSFWLGLIVGAATLPVLRARRLLRR